jgi:hypothetical protein
VIFFEVCESFYVNSSVYDVKKGLNRAIKCVDSDARLKADDMLNFNISDLKFPNNLPSDG